MHIKHFNVKLTWLYFICYGVASFDCSTATSKVKAHYDMLINLPIELILHRLLVKGVISANEKKKLDCKAASCEKMIYIVDSVITPSLLNDISIKYQGFLEVLEESGNSTMIDLAKLLGMCTQLMTTTHYFVTMMYQLLQVHSQKRIFTF